MRLIATLICALALTGCAHEYAAYAEAHKAQAAAQTARYQALADIARRYYRLPVGRISIGVGSIGISC